MNSNVGVTIRTHAELVAERARLEALIDNQKNIIRHDLDELKAEFKKEIRPAIDTANFVKKFARPEKRNHAILNLATNFAIDLVFKKVLKNSNVVFQFLVPKILKNYTSHFIGNVSNHRAAQPQNGVIKKLPTRLVNQDVEETGVRDSQ